MIKTKADLQKELDDMYALDKLRWSADVSADDDHSKKILSLHVLYLDKLEKLTTAERLAITKYLAHLGDPFISGNPLVEPLYNEESK